MSLFYFSLTLTVASTALYHVFQKVTPVNVNPLLTLAVTYSISAVVCVLLLPLIPLQESVPESLRKLNWASVALAFAIVGLEVGYLLAYRAGWNISLMVLVSNIGAILALVPVGMLLFKERITPLNAAGIAVCIIGLVMVNRR